MKRHRLFLATLAALAIAFGAVLGATGAVRAQSDPLTLDDFDDRDSVSASEYTVRATHVNRVVRDVATDAEDILFGTQDGERRTNALAELTPPAQVTGLTATADDHDSINVEWDAVTDATGYVVEWDDDSAFGSSTTATVASGSTTSHQITGLAENTEYYVRVYATRTGAADGTVSDTVTATTLLPTPAQVTGVNATADDHDSISVNWNAVTDADGYVVQWDDDSAFGNPAEATLSQGTATSHQISGLTEDTEYYVRVYATRTGAPDGDVSSAASAETDLQAPDRVTGLTADTATDVSVSLSWDLATRAGGYIVQWRETGETFDADRQRVTETLTLTVTGLDPVTAYWFRVTGTRSGAPNGQPSAAIQRRTETAPTPAQVTGLTATAISDTEIRVEWSAATSATGYVVQWHEDGGQYSDDMQAVVPGTVAIIEDLDAATVYLVRVYGTRAGAVDGAPSAEDSATTEIAPVHLWAHRFPGGVVGAQLALSIFGGVFSGIKLRKFRSPRREASILIFMCLGGLILPVLGIGNLFWTAGIAALVGLAALAVIFTNSRS